MTLVNVIENELTDYENEVLTKIFREFQWDYDTDKVLVLWKDKTRRLIRTYEINDKGVICWYTGVTHDLSQATLENTWDYELDEEDYK